MASMRTFLNTFSIVARCHRTEMLGVAVSTAVLGVGARCPHVKAGVGAAATQSWINPYLGIDALRLMSEGFSAPEAQAKLLEDDPGRRGRQLGLVDRDGRSAAWSGPECVPWFGHIAVPNCAIQGNMLVGEETLKAMLHAFENAELLELPERLLVALEAGQAAGGDKRGKQSAALLVAHREEYAYCDLRVDEHRHPVAELRRIFEIARSQLTSYVRGLPTRANPLGAIDDETRAMLLAPPPYRPGGGGSAPE